MRQWVHPGPQARTPVIRKILRHLGLATEPPRVAAARPPPELAFEFA
jgi:hypothetical protein